MAKDTLHHHPAALPPMSAVARILSQFDRGKLEGFITVAIGLLDSMDGDAEAEEILTEDGFIDANSVIGYAGPGCPGGDPGGCEHDGKEPDHDAEVETWSHWMDHPAELHIGHRPGHTDAREVR